MIFSLYLGDPAGHSRWVDALRRHAAWLELAVAFEPRPVRGAAVLDVARIGPPEPLPFALQTQADGAVRCTVPAALPGQLHHARVDGAHVLSDDLRLYARLIDPAVDLGAASALFAFGVIPAPLTLFRAVRRVPNGHSALLRADAAAPVWTPAVPAPEPAGGEPPVARLTAALDRSLARGADPAVLLFSGGVDSGLLAARLARQGRRVTLLNYAFGERDPEAALARDMAGSLGLPYHRVLHDPRAADGVLERASRDYTFPFGDLSVVPTHALARAALAAHPRTVFDGTGADGAFGVGLDHARYRRWGALPRPLRAAAGAAYAGWRLWRADSPAERLCGFLRQTCGMPLLEAALAQNALDGIAFDAPQEGMPHAARAAVAGWIAGVPAAEALSRLDLTWVCAGRMAPKSFDPLRAAGAGPRYPFLENPLVSLAGSLAWAEKGLGGTAKGLLKAALALDVPAHWVYRAKSGFTPPYAALFTSPGVRARLFERALRPDNPLLAATRADGLDELARRVRAGRALAAGAFDFLWALLFATAWLDGLPRRASAHAPDHEHVEEGAGAAGRHG